MRGHHWLIPLLLLFTPAEAASRDPRVPPDVDPGGVAVALVCTGIDYTLPHIASRLARDGEGELIGWDFRDDDPLPFESTSATLDGGGTALAQVILAEAPEARIIPVRIDPERPGSLLRAMAFVGQTPARIVLLAAGVTGGGEQEQFREAAVQFGQLLIIIPADTRLEAIATAASGLENALIASATQDLRNADISVEAADLEAAEHEASGRLPPSFAAAARAAGRAAIEAMRLPGRDGAGLKQIMIKQAR